MVRLWILVVGKWILITELWVLMLGSCILMVKLDFEDTWHTGEATDFILVEPELCEYY